MSSYYGDSGRATPSWDALDAGYDDDVLDQSEYQFANRDHILFAIDAAESMHTPMPDEENAAGRVRGKSPLHHALAAIVEIERSKVITGPNDSIGVLLFNVDPAKAPKATSQNYKPGTYVLQQLQQINAEGIKKLIKIVEAADEQLAEQDDSDEPTAEPAVLRDTFTPIDTKEKLNAADVLLTCNFIFRDGGTKLAGSKRVFLVTDDDDPPGSSNPTPATTVYGDLSAYGVGVNPCFVSRPDHAFDASKYWDAVLQRDDNNQPIGGFDQLDEMMNDLVVRTAPKRKQFTIPLRFGGRDGDIEIGVGGYSLIATQTKGQPKLVRMRGQVVEEVETRTQYTSAETGGELQDSDITTAFQFGDEAKIQNVLEPNWWESAVNQEEQAMYAEELLRLTAARKENGEDVDEEMEVAPGPSQTNGAEGGKRITVRTRLQFSEKEIASFRSMDLDPQIKILGFQSPDKLLDQDNIKHSYFIYPDETVYTGSIRTFTALLKSCIKLDRHALALCRFRQNSSPEMCVLVPQEETFTDDGVQDDAPGFHVIILPFVDDIRDQPRNIRENISATDDQTIKMEKIIRRLKFKSNKYQPAGWPNPTLAYHQRQLQALAFDEDFDTEAFEDKALPKYNGIHKTAGKLMKEWNELINEDERATETLTASTKRHVVEVDEGDLADVLGAYEKGTIDKLKVADLKSYAKFHKIPLAGITRKADIIDALQEHLVAASKQKKAKKA